tara:strand:+ start:6444 stop:6767 length:324 start_codon:yes stop_codon:yes gene_type:complete
MLLFDFPFILESLCGITHTNELDITGIALVIYLLLLTSLFILSIVWTLKEKKEGAVIGIGIGIFLLVFGLNAFLQLGQIDAFLSNSTRGLLTVLLSYTTYRELKNIS